MKKILITLLVLFLSFNKSDLYAQSGFRFYLGYNAFFTSKKGLEDLNYIFKRYNENRPSLTKKLESVGNLSGAAFKMSLGTRGFIADLTYARGGQKQYAEGPNSNGDIQRKQVKTRYTNLEAAFGYAPQGINSPVVVGLSCDMISLNVYTRSGAPDNINKVQWAKPGNPASLGLGPFIRLTSPGKKGLSAEFYFRRDVAPQAGRRGLLNLNVSMNPQSWHTDTDDLGWIGHQAGIRIMFTFTTTK
ncbi:MAG: hypothetical protein JNK73_02620 [Bacteroidia bacterium]|nr:hypothetical protein [Bacteroidia bacterium]